MTEARRSPADLPAGAVAAASAASKPQEYRWQIVPATQFGRYMQAWASIRSASELSPVIEPYFIDALVRTFGRGDEVLAICGTSQAPYAMGILRRTRAGVWETFQPSQAPLSPWMHRRELSYGELMPSLIRALPGVPLIVGVTQKDPDIHARPEATARLKMLDYVQTARILVNRSFEDYWSARDKKIRYEIGRRLKRLAERGIRPRLEMVSEAGDVADAIEAYGSIEAAGWKAAAGTAVRSDNRQGLFYRTVLTEFCARGKGRIYRYCFGDQIVAMQLCVEGSEKLVFLKTAYLEQYRSYGPGILMKHAIFEQVFREARLKAIEFYGAFIDWQGKWCDEVRTLYHVNYYRWPWLAEAQEVLHAVAPRVRANRNDENTRAGSVSPEFRHGRRSYVATIYDDLPGLPLRYESLFSRAGRISLFHTLPWYRNFRETVIAPDERLRIYAIDRTEKSPGAVLLMRYRSAGGGGLLAPRVLSGVSNYYTSLFGPVMDLGGTDTQQILDELAAAIAGDQIRWDIIDLHPLAVDPVVFPGLIAAFRKAGLLVQTYFCFGNWYLQVKSQTFKEYIEGRTSRLSKTARRQRRSLEAKGRFRFELFSDVEGLERGIADYSTVYHSSWKVPEPYPDFMGGLMRACARQGWIRLGIVYLDGTPAAAQFWTVVEGKASIYKMAYDERFAKDSVGTVLSSMLMEHVIDVDKVHEVDYLTGDDAYKKDWMSDRRERWGIMAFNLRSPKGLIAASRHVGGRVGRRALDAARRFVRERRSTAR